MPDKPALTRIKRYLLAARGFIADAITRSRADDRGLAERLKDLSERLENEIEYVDVQLAKLP